MNAFIPPHSLTNPQLTHGRIAARNELAESHAHTTKRSEGCRRQ